MKYKLHYEVSENNTVPVFVAMQFVAWRIEYSIFIWQKKNFAFTSPWIYRH